MDRRCVDVAVVRDTFDSLFAERECCASSPLRLGH